jgi:hypothetical protein
MSVESATAFLDRIRVDADFRDSFSAQLVESCQVEFDQIREKARSEANNAGFDFTPEELYEARLEALEKMGPPYVMRSLSLRFHVVLDPFEDGNPPVACGMARANG